MTVQFSSGIREAVVSAGGQVELSKQLGVSQQAVSTWVRQGWVPVPRIVEIEALYGIDRARLINPKHLAILAPVRFEG